MQVEMVQQVVNRELFRVLAGFPGLIEVIRDQRFWKVQDQLVVVHGCTIALYGAGPTTGTTACVAAAGAGGSWGGTVGAGLIFRVRIPQLVQVITSRFDFVSHS